MSLIEVSHVTKCFPLERRLSLRYNLQQIIRRWPDSSEKVEETGFCALRDIHFSIEAGETVGFIGRNGAGKTTLLRLLAGITAPTHGTVRVNGDFAALIGLAAGFDNERTGLENIYLNAAIYGRRVREIRAIEQDIVDFAELGDFLQKPVKHYSSGMVARLGFSIATHLVPQILFLDEILSVGDLAFQQKCKQRITGLTERGCTLVIVAHSPQELENLCERALWLEKGALVQDGSASEVLRAYRDSVTQN